MRVLTRVGLMSGSAVIISAATIIYFNSTVPDDRISQVANQVELAAITLMPYMISAAIAAITAIGVIAALPLLRLTGSVSSIHERLRALARGDLSTRVRVGNGNDQLQAVMNQLNNTVATLGHDIAQWKLINRRQWDILQAIRRAGKLNDLAAMMNHVEEMEQNWSRIAEIEERLVT